MTDEEIDDQILEKNLRGTTLKVYYVLLTESAPLSLREVQRKAGLSSPSLALHHLDKLKSLNLVQSNPHGGYSTIREVRIGILRFFIGRRRLLFPRYFLYFVFFLTELVGYVLIFGMRPSPIDLLLVITLSMICIITLYEAVIMWYSRPIH